jgi:XTP/dITP diphosphohydrolase
MTAVAVVEKLRSPEGGCPWDLKQTHVSLRPYMLEEAYEAVGAIDEANPNALRDELGDVFLQVLLHAQVAKDNGEFDLADVAQGLADKLIRRHPHVFTDAPELDSPEAVTKQWQSIKEEEGSKSIWEKPPTYLPALMLADKVSMAAVKEGFKWPDFETLWACVLSEVEELREAIDASDITHQEEELGDLFFALVSLAGAMKLNPEVALTQATNKFLKRYRSLRGTCDKPISEYSFEELDAKWREAKLKTASPA